MASTARIDELKKKFDENPRRYFAPLANEFRKAGDIEQAILICEEFLPQQAGHMSGHIVYGQALYEAGRVPEARGVFETALGLDPENLIALRHLGDIARGQTDPVAARSWYARVLDADPRNEEIQALIGAIDSESPQSVVTASPSPSAIDAPYVSRGIELDMEPTSLDTPPPGGAGADHPATEFTPVTSPFGETVVPPPLPSRAVDAELLDGFSLHGLESALEADARPHTHVAAEGLESASFEPPVEHIPTTDQLDDSLDSGVPSFSVPSTTVDAPDGLQGSEGMDHREATDAHAVTVEEFTPLDLDDESTLPPQGDPLAADFLPAATASAPHQPEVASDELLDFEAPVLEQEGRETAGFLDESELLDEPVSAHAPFVTETMAELYLAQGLRAEARSVYEQLLAAKPGDARLSALVSSLALPAVVADTGPSARQFFAKLAARRPALRAADATLPADDDFAPPGAAAVPSEHDVPDHPPADAPFSVEEAETLHEAPEAMAPAIERAAAMRTPDGSISALFGNRTPGTSEDSAASALAQAFGGEAAAAVGMSGRPAHAAAGELSLDSVFRDGAARPPRTSQSFSFDQFFTGGGEPERTPPRISSEMTMPVEAPAERNAEDVEKFNSWLQGLKPQ